MKTEDLIKVLRKLIKEEVQKTVADEVNKSMARLLSEVINNRASTHTGKSFVGEQVEQEQEAPPQKQYAKNNRLNEALNSTVPDLRARDAKAGFTSPRASLMDMFDKIEAPEEAYAQPQPQRPQDVVLDTSSKINMLKSIVSPEPVGQQVSVLDHVAATPIANVFKKDFRALMKKMDQQKDKGGGGFFAGAIPMTPQIGGYDQH